MRAGAFSRRARRVVAVSTAALCGGFALPAAVAAAPAASSTTSPTNAATEAAGSQTLLAVRDHSARDLGAYGTANPIRLSIGLRPPHPAAEQKYLDALQDESSPDFHHYLSTAQWTARFGPSAAAQQKVVAWAKAAGITVTHLYPNRLVVDVTGTAGAVEHALGVQIENYRLGTQSFFANNANPVVPAALASIVGSISGLNDRQNMHPSSPTPHEPANRAYVAGPVVARGPHGAANGSRTKLRAATSARRAGPNITSDAYDPTDIYSSQAYDYTALSALGHCCNPLGNAASSPAQTSIAIATFGAQDMNDIAAFHTQYPYLAYNVQEVNIDGTPEFGDTEGTMDIEWSTATSNSFGANADTAKVYAYDAANFDDSTIIDQYNAMLNDNLARVFSTSWSCTEITGCPASMITQEHAIFDEMVGQGWTLVAASGDRGAYDDCATKSVSYPASDPDVVGAGGTQLTLNADSTYNSETAWSAGLPDCFGNDGGSGGGCSALFSAPAYQTNEPCGSGSRAVPDLSLNADWFNTPQNTYVEGMWYPNGGTSIVAPELAGFFAQENAYLLAEGSICGSGASACAPMGNANFPLYRDALLGAPHNPFYDITSGCNSNFIGTGYCAGTGDDLVTGWGSANMLQLAWGFNWRLLADAGKPTVAFSGAVPHVWYRTDEPLGITVADTGGGFPASGVAGFSAAWNTDPGDPTSAAAPGSGNSFYKGPEHVNTTSETLDLAFQLQGCNTLNVEAWDNMGYQSGDVTDGPLCFDSQAPLMSAPPSSALVKSSSITNGNVPVRIKWSAFDATSGVKSYRVDESVDGGAYTTVGRALRATSKVLSLPSGHSYRFRVRATDHAGNVGRYSIGKVFHVRLFEENKPAVAYTSGWTRVAQPGASGGFVRETTLAGRKATFTFSGVQVGFVTTTSPDNGEAKIMIDGRRAGVVDTNAPDAAAQMRFVETLPGAGPHTFVVDGLGTAGHPNVDVDAFVVIS